MTVSDFIRVTALTIAASYATYALEALAPIHPVVRRGAQGAIVMAAAYAVLHALRLA